MEENREFTNKPTGIWSIHLLANKARIYNGEKTTYSIYIQYWKTVYKRIKLDYFYTIHTYPHTHKALNLN